MTNYSPLLFICSILISLNTWAGVNGVGNGGDAIVCKASAQNFLNGTYSLDYLLTLQNTTVDLDVVQVKSWDESADRIFKLLQVKLPELAVYFDEYRKSTFKSDFTQRHVWEPTPFGLMDLKDENIKSQLPANCKNGDQAQISQAVIREFASHSGAATDHVVYKYMPTVIDELKKSNPLQLSYLLVHEWLWDFSSNVERNRRFNRLLHSPRFEQIPKEDLKDLLRGMGFILPSIQPGVYDSQSCQGNRLTMKDITDRYTSSSFTDNIGKLEFSGRSRTLNCSTSSPNCLKTWNANNGIVFRDNEFFAAFSWDHLGDPAPLKIVSPALFSQDGIRYRPGYYHLECRILDNTETNLECSILADTVISELTGVRGQMSLSSLPKLRGVLTDECLRIENTYTEVMPTIGPAGSSKETIEYQKVFLLRFAWNR